MTYLGMLIDHDCLDYKLESFEMFVVFRALNYSSWPGGKVADKTFCIHCEKTLNNDHVRFYDR